MRRSFHFGCPLTRVKNKANIKLINPESVRGRLREYPFARMIKNRVFVGGEMEFGDGGRR